MSQNKQSQQGSVLIYILIGVVLFSMVMFAFTRNNTSTTVMSKAQAKTTASDLLDYSNTIASAVQKLITRGCSENEISFDNSAVTGFANPNSPSSGDKRCWIFDPAGGNINYKKAASFNIAGITFVAQSNLLKIGSDCTNTSCADLILFATIQNRPLCEALNETLNLTDLKPLPSTTYVMGSPPFQGVFGPYHAATNSIFSGKTAACYNYSPTPTNNYFFYVLLAR